MSKTEPIVTIIGGPGFVGRAIALRMAQQGWHVRLASRTAATRSAADSDLSHNGMSSVACDIRDPASVAAAIEGSQAVVNTVGVLWENGANTFQATQAEGAANVARAAAAAGVAQLIHLSAIGASAERGSAYAATKHAGEQAVIAAFPAAVILRPSIIFGAGDSFFNQFAAMSKLTPVLPLVGANTRFQPVWVEDVAEAAAKAAGGGVEPGIYELGGPRVATFRECMELMLDVVKRKRLIADIPKFVAGIQGWVLEKSALFGIQPVLTRDQVKLLDYDNVVGEGTKGFADLGIEPSPMEAVLESYLSSHRSN